MGSALLFGLDSSVPLCKLYNQLLEQQSKYLLHTSLELANPQHSKILQYKWNKYQLLMNYKILLGKCLEL